MAPTNITFRVNTNGRFYVYEHHWQREKEPIVGPDGKPIPMGTVDPDTCCYVAGDFNGWAGFFWEEGWDPSSEPYRMYDHDGDGIYEATVEVPAPPTDAALLSADQPTPEQLESQGWRVLNSTAYYTWKVAGLNWGQQETIGMHEPLPEDGSCLLGPSWNGALTASNTALTSITFEPNPISCARLLQRAKQSFSSTASSQTSFFLAHPSSCPSTCGAPARCLRLRRHRCRHRRRHLRHRRRC